MKQTQEDKPKPNPVADRAYMLKLRRGSAIFMLFAALGIAIGYAFSR